MLNSFTCGFILKESAEIEKKHENILNKHYRVVYRNVLVTFWPDDVAYRSLGFAKYPVDNA